MRCSTLLLAGLALAGATPAFAQDQTAAAATAGPTAPPATLTFNGTATVVSDYRFRGISQTDKNFAVQGTFTITHASGFYVSVFGSSVDDYVTASGQGHQEIDLIGGYKKTIAERRSTAASCIISTPRRSCRGRISIRTSSNPMSMSRTSSDR